MGIFSPQLNPSVKPLAKAFQPAASYDPGMDDIYGIRRRNFDRVLAMPVMASARLKVDKGARIGISASMFSQLQSPSYKIGDDMARKIEAELGLETGWMDNPAEGSQSQPAQLDIDRLGVALTAIDKALRDMEVQGSLGTLSDAVQFAYGETFELGDIRNSAQLALFDRIVATHLRGWNGQEREVGDTAEGAGKNRKAAPQRKKAGTGR